MFSLLDQHWGSSNVGRTAKRPACLLHRSPLQTLTPKAMEVCQPFCSSSNCRVALHGTDTAPALTAARMIFELTCKPCWLWKSQFLCENRCKEKDLQCCGRSNQKLILWVKDFELAGNSNPWHKTKTSEHERDLILFTLYILITPKM